MRFSLLALSAAAALLFSGCTKNIYLPQATPQMGLQLRVKLPTITATTSLDTVRTVLELVNNNDEPYVVSSPARPQASLPVVQVDGHIVPWELHQRRGKDVRITIPAHGTYRTAYDLPLSYYAGGPRRPEGLQRQIQVFYHGRVYGPVKQKATRVEIPSNKLAF
ncbi:hypothetical protein F0P96_01745 [Hymenobacter busanensis]|uniref:Uncharacterized protein n=1 Tax=Hymenobacter busanensis TaxID=2607656 RepID=A0A7L4ZUK5_9BACT|nr:hypothetical protein [Hymenobacter busanensis]KAA9339368.1 hypothetical protein F0P96_01745 [Hymenobacter busanensis]QHJ06871.1 hypothetical protein GUY19_06005 [Hymenobacter busanensis]